MQDELIEISVPGQEASNPVESNRVSFLLSEVAGLHLYSHSYNREGTVTHTGLIVVFKSGREMGCEAEVSDNADLFELRAKYITDKYNELRQKLGNNKKENQCKQKE